MHIVGMLLILIGFCLSLTIIGAFVGIPLMMIGVFMTLFGYRRRNVITNVITVQNAPPAYPPAPISAQSTPMATPPTPAAPSDETGV